MKRLIKKIMVSALAVMMVCSCFFFTGCRDVKKLEITVSVRVEEDGLYKLEEQKLTIDLYRHLADKTVDAIMEYANSGYYNGTFFYQTIRFNDDTTHNTKLLIGDLRFDETTGTIVKNAAKPNIEGQFTHGGTVGSDLMNVEGSVGLWRTWNANDSYSSYNSTNTGSATLYFPTGDITAYNDCFCVFGKFDVESDGNKDAWANIKTSCSDADYYDEYVIYYTGEYSDAADAVDNGLTFHCVTKAEYDSMSEEQLEEVFKAEGAQSVAYNSCTIRVPMYQETNTSRAVATSKIVSIRVV